MSGQAHAGIRAARALLSLIEDNTAEDFEAAESILGGEQDLTSILKMLRKFKEHEDEPLSVERLRAIVRGEILGLPLTVSDMIEAANAMVADMQLPPTLTIESVLDQALVQLQATSHRPSSDIDDLTGLLVESAATAGAEYVTRAARLLRDLAIRALAENLAIFPSLHSLSQLRTRWATEPLPYKHQEPRRSLAKRLVTDGLQGHDEAHQIAFLRDMLRESLRGPADTQIAAVRRMKPKKAHGE